MCVRMEDYCKEFDRLYNSNRNSVSDGYVLIDSVDNDIKMCDLMKKMKNSNDVFKRLEKVVEFDIPEVVYMCFDVMNKFDGDQYVQIQAMCVVRYMMFERGVNISKDMYEEYISRIIRSMKLVEGSSVINCENLSRTMSGYLNNCVMILYKMGVKKSGGYDLSVLSKLYNKYYREDDIIDLMYCHMI